MGNGGNTEQWIRTCSGEQRLCPVPNPNPAVESSSILVKRYGARALFLFGSVR